MKRKPKTPKPKTYDRTLNPKPKFLSTRTCRDGRTFLRNTPCPSSACSFPIVSQRVHVGISCIQVPQIGPWAYPIYLLGPTRSGVGIYGVVQKLKAFGRVRVGVLLWDYEDTSFLSTRDCLP